MKNINSTLLMENCESIARKDIRINGYNWKAHRYYYNAMKAFESHPAIESVNWACDIIIEGKIYEGVVVAHRDGRVYPMTLETFRKLTGFMGA